MMVWPGIRKREDPESALQALETLTFSSCLDRLVRFDPWTCFALISLISQTFHFFSMLDNSQATRMSFTFFDTDLYTSISLSIYRSIYIPVGRAIYLSIYITAI